MRHVPSVHQSGSGRYLAKAVGLAGCVLRWLRTHWVLARGLQFNPQAPDVCQTMAVFRKLDCGPTRQYAPK